MNTLTIPDASSLRNSNPQDEDLRTVFYRARFEVYPDASPDLEIWPLIIGVLQDWVTGKEKRRKHSPILKKIKSGKSARYIVQQHPRKEGTLSYTFAEGKMGVGGKKSEIATKAYFDSKDDVIPRYWAMRYLEKDGQFKARHWQTDVGVTRTGDGIYAVNACITIIDDSNFILNRPEIPARNVPRFIKDLLEMPECVSFAGDAELFPRAKQLDENNFQEFVDALYSKERTVPIVVAVASDRYHSGKYSIDVEELAETLRGAAIVYKFDRSDKSLFNLYNKEFGKGGRGYEYRLNFGALRIFSLNVNPADPDDHYRHRFYSPEQLAKYNKQDLLENICVAAIHLNEHPEREAHSIFDIRRFKSRDKVNQYRRGVQQRTQCLSDSDDKQRNKSLLGSDDKSKARNKQEKERFEEKKSRKELKRLEKELEKLQGEYDELFDSYENDLNEKDLLRKENRGLSQRIEILESKDASLQHSIDELSKQVNASNHERDAALEQASLIYKLEKFPGNTRESLNLAIAAFGDRIAASERALSSANSFSGDPNEVFVILRAISQYIWPYYFENENTGDMVAYFKAQTGYELTFHESAMTQNDSDLMALREVEYNGKSYDISPHVKGRKRKVGEALRVHFCKLEDDQKVLIGYCGDHLETAGTRRKS